jgi:hypothetical protein
MSRTGRIFGVLIASFILINQGSPVRAQVPTAAISAAAAERATLGLPSDTPTVEWLLTSGQDVGTERWGIPMTADEERRVDLPGRMAFAQQAKEAAVPFAQKLPDFAGAYIDQAEGGKLVILFVGGGKAADRQAIADLLPAGGLGVEFRTAKYSFTQLYRAWSGASEAWPGNMPLLATRIDERANMIWLEVAQDDLPATSRLGDELSTAWGIPVGIRAAESMKDASCTDRLHCTNPMKAGNLVYNKIDSNTIALCTMGFHVSNGSGDVDKQWVTAGHCGYQRDDSWYHWGMPDTDFIGNKTKNLYTSDGIDIMRVQMPDGQVSKAIWGSAWLVETERPPLNDEEVCASLGYTNTVDCGNVSTAFYHWTSSSCGCAQQGADVNGITIQGGDSGSPVYAIFNQHDVALGSISTTGGAFAEIQDALNFWGGAWKVHGT